METNTLLRNLIRACVDDERTLQHESKFVDATRAAALTRLARERGQFIAELERLGPHEEPHDGSWRELSRELGRDLRVTAGGRNSTDAITACRHSRARTETVYDEAMLAPWPDEIARVLRAQRGSLRDETGELDRLQF
jgi:hypothetical protein